MHRTFINYRISHNEPVILQAVTLTLRCPLAIYWRILVPRTDAKLYLNLAKVDKIIKHTFLISITKYCIQIPNYRTSIITTMEVSYAVLKCVLDVWSSASSVHFVASHRASLSTGKVLLNRAEHCTGNVRIHCRKPQEWTPWITLCIFSGVMPPCNCSKTLQT